jgi:hypothetical protein
MGIVSWHAGGYKYPVGYAEELITRPLVKRVSPAAEQAGLIYLAVPEYVELTLEGKARKSAS